MPSGSLAALYHTLSSSERMPCSICSLRREALSRTSFQKQARFPTWIIWELFLFRLASESFKVSSPSRSEVHAFGRRGAGFRESRVDPSLKACFLSFRCRHCSRSFYLSVHAFETFHSFIFTGNVAQFCCLSSDPALCLQHIISHSG